jgi:hypothetical protein
MEVANMMKDGGFSATAVVAVYDECAHWKEFAAISISHCNRLCNSVAPELARQALLEKSSQVWVDDAPYIYPAVACKRCIHFAESIKLAESFQKKNCKADSQYTILSCKPIWVILTLSLEKMLEELHEVPLY